MLGAASRAGLYLKSHLTVAPPLLDSPNVQGRSLVDIETQPLFPPWRQRIFQLIASYRNYATMLKLPCSLAAMAIFASALSAASQEDRPYYDTKVNANLIETWLHSDDPRMVTFGANFAVENSDDGLVTTMEQMVAQWNPPQGYSIAAQDQCEAMAEILHALILKKEKVPPEVISSVASSFPDYAIILASRLPRYEAIPLYQSWYEGKGRFPGTIIRFDGENHWRTAGGNGRMLARVAAMMLSRKPPSGFAASILADSVERLVVSVRSDEAAADPCRLGCSQPKQCPGDAENGPPRAGWPPLFQYEVEENYPQPDSDSLLVAAGGDRITFRRAPANWKLASCWAPLSLNAETRHRLLAQMLGVDEGHMPWQAEKVIALRWENREKFLLELGSQVNFEEAQFRATVQMLFAKGLLTRAEADGTRPKLQIVVLDDRINSQLPNPELPRLTFRDPRTSYR